MSKDLLVIVDDNSGAFSYTGSTSIDPWLLNTTFDQCYGATCHTAWSRVCNVDFTFNGTSAAFIGITPDPLFRQTATVQIDNESSFVINYGDALPPSHKQWFITPTLPDGRHTITISNVDQASLDYAVVKVGSQTPLTGQIVIVDDDSPLVQYSGQWSRNLNRFIPGTFRNLLPGDPYCNVTHRSSNPGDMFTFRFSGTFVAVYGIFSWRTLGSLAATYSIDGTPHSGSVSVNISSPGYMRDYGEVSNYLYFRLDGLISGPHTLSVNITEANNHTFILDYITYEPAFDTLSSMPSLSSATSNSASRQSVSTGAIVGGVLGGVAFGVLVTILVMWFLSRRRRAREQDFASQATLGGLNDPNILSPHTPIIGGTS